MKTLKECSKQYEGVAMAAPREPENIRALVDLARGLSFELLDDAMGITNLLTPISEGPDMPGIDKYDIKSLMEDTVYRLQNAREILFSIRKEIDYK